MNKVVLLGNLGADAELRVLGNGSVLKFSLATTETWKDKTTGEKKEKAQWHRCELFGPRADSLAQYLTKGTKIVVEGSIDYQQYEKDGEKKYATSIKVRDVHFAGGKRDQHEAPAAADSSDDIPF